MNAKRLALIALALGATLLFSALGVWQVERLSWKRDLLARVEARVHAPPLHFRMTLNPQADAYRRITATGTFMGGDTRVKAVTAHGAGYWLLAPLRTAQGIVLVNRGFVPTDGAARPVGEATVTGLLRASEPGGGFLRANDPARDQWFSRDVAAIARARGLGTVAPFFLDAEATPQSGGYPIGGLTVVRFSNNHLVYALTWFALAGLSAAAAFLLLRRPD